ncbi:MAG: GntR family transcriptional regulator, partial [Novosphingobium sp.]|nr:GntR family transcriptional regulator [Novosphingobium sp.]
MGFVLGKVQKRSAEVQAADKLREAIVSGRIPLGARLTEVSSAEQLGVARSTIRTALHQLVQDGLVIQVPYTG